MAAGESLEEFASDMRAKIELFELAYTEKHRANPEHYPLFLREDNSGLWLEFFIDFVTNGTV